MARAFDPKAKEKRQKIIAAVGALILVALLVWRVPQVLAMMNKKAPPPPKVSTSPAPAPVPGLPVVSGAPTTSPATLIDTDAPLAPETGQLVSFGRFVSKDPFAQQLGGTQSVGGPRKSVKSPRKPIGVLEPELAVEPEPEPEPSATSEPKTPAVRSAARISVNGDSESVAAGAAFPAADPVFELVSVGARTAKIAIEGGSYASGAATITLRKGEPVTLVNTADGTRYRLLLH
jgi:hypothetical protein